MKKIIASVILTLIVFLIAFTPDYQLRRPNDFYFEVAVGNVRDHDSINKFGRNSDIDSSIEDIWDGGGAWNEPTVGQVYTVTSTSTADTGAGTGARTLQISGLISDTGLLASETITMAGTSWVTLTNNYQMIHRLIVLSVGSGSVNAGTIYAVGNTDGTVTAQINPGNNQTLMAVYKIPANRRGCLLNYYSSINRATGANTLANVFIKAKPNGQAFQTKQIIGISTISSGFIEHTYYAPNCFDPLTIVKMSADASANDTDISAGFDMILRP
jgi:hypothetical protein